VVACVDLKTSTRKRKSETGNILLTPSHRWCWSVYVTSTQFFSSFWSWLRLWNFVPLILRLGVVFSNTENVQTYTIYRQNNGCVNRTNSACLFILLCGNCPWTEFVGCMDLRAFTRLMFSSRSLQTGLLQFRVLAGPANGSAPRNHVACQKRICGLSNEHVSTCPQGREHSASSVVGRSVVTVNW